MHSFFALFILLFPLFAMFLTLCNLGKSRMNSIYLHLYLIYAYLAFEEHVKETMQKSQSKSVQTEQYWLKCFNIVRTFLVFP